MVRDTRFYILDLIRKLMCATGKTVSTFRDSILSSS